MGKGHSAERVVRDIRRRDVYYRRREQILTRRERIKRESLKRRKRENLRAP
jgi:hypothetical protein